MNISEIPTITGNLFNFNLSKSLPYRYRIRVDNFGFTYYPELTQFGTFTYSSATSFIHSIFPVYIDNINIQGNNIKITVSTVKVEDNNTTTDQYVTDCLNYNTLKSNPYEVPFTENVTYRYSSFFSTINISFVTL